MQKLLLHICCGVCASSVVKRLREENFDVVGFFYNPNIHPEEEYLRRKEVVKEVARILDLPLILGSYDKEAWFNETRGLENEPEGGLRCSVCFKMRLAATKKKAEELGIEKFSTTLTVSPHKNAAQVYQAGSSVGGENFLFRDFKKKDGFKLAIEFAKRYNLYRQNYCGCIYSKRENQNVKPVF